MSSNNIFLQICEKNNYRFEFIQTFCPFFMNN